MLREGSHRPEEIFVHDFSMTISEFSMTISLIYFAFAAFCGKLRKMRTFYIDALFLSLSGGKKIQIWFTLGAKLVEFLD